MRNNSLRGRLTSGFDGIANGESCFFLPAMVGLPPKVVDILACLPIANVNAELIASLSRLEGVRPVDFGCIFAADPFYDSARLSDDILSFGVHGVANLPSLGFLTGPFSDAMSASGFDFHREMHCLLTAKRRGLQTAAFVWSLEQGICALDQGPDIVVIHPRRPAGIEDSPRLLADKAATTVSELRERSKSSCQIALYRHPALFEKLEMAAELADGVVLYGT
jgi:predicted TIM-barrel enzyme